MSFIKRTLSKIRTFLGIGIGFIANYSGIAVTFVENLKKITDGQLDNKFSSLFPKALPPTVVAFLERVTPIVLLKVSQAHNLLHKDWQNMDGQAILDELVTALRAIDKQKKSPFLADLAAHVGHRLADGRYSLDEVWEDCQIFYNKWFKKK
jgi:hypothetical protein